MAQTLTEPWLEPRVKYRPSLENFICAMSNTDKISAAAYPVPISYMRTVVRFRLLSFEPIRSTVVAPDRRLAEKGGTWTTT